MAIDPRLYEKYSGRSGDPYKRMGEALSQSAAQKQSTAAAKDKSIYERHLEAKFKVRVGVWVVIGVIAAVMAIIRAVTR